MISPYGAFISYQVNVDAQGNNILGDARTNRRLQWIRQMATK
jgi:hypothetical protein